MSELSVGQLRGLTVNSNVITVPNGHKLYAPGHVLQVVTASTSTRVSSSTTTLVPTGLEATITPLFTTSRILVMVNQNGVSKYAGNVGNGITLRLQKNNSNLALMGDFLAYTGTSLANIVTASIIYTDTPGSLSPITYRTVFANIVNASQVTVQELSDLSTITLMEIA